MRFRLVLLTLALWAPALARSQGGPPLITDDPDTVSPGHWEINLGLIAQQSRAERTLDAPHVDINYGANERTQLKWEVPWTFWSAAGEGTRNGLGNSSVGVKWRFRDEDRRGPALSTYPQLTFNNPTSSARRGVAERGAALFLPLEVKRSFGHTALDADAGVTIHWPGEQEWAYGLAVGHDASDRLQLLGELHGAAVRNFREHAVLLNVGARYRVDSHKTLLLAIGRSVAGSVEDRLDLLAYVGLQITR